MISKIDDLISIKFIDQGNRDLQPLYDVKAMKNIFYENRVHAHETYRSGQDKTWIASRLGWCESQSQLPWLLYNPCTWQIELSHRFSVMWNCINSFPPELTDPGRPSNGQPCVRVVQHRTADQSRQRKHLPLQGLIKGDDQITLKGVNGCANEDIYYLRNVFDVILGDIQ